MRVPNISLYDTSRYQLNTITNDLRDANEVVSTQKQINNISDDPIGLSQVLDLRLTLENLDQIDKNVEMGRSWLAGVETALSSISDQIIEAKLLSTQMANASVSATERKDAAATVTGIIDQILSLGNTQVNGSYIFSGTKTNVRTFTYDDASDPTEVIYHGNETSFSVKTGETTKLAVGRNGEEMLEEDRITVDGTNNKIFFREDPGEGENAKIILEGTIPDGEYTPEELAIVVRNAMNKASLDDGYGINYSVEYDTDSQTYSFGHDGTFDGYMGFDLLWDSGEEPRIGGLNTEGIIVEGVNINVVNDAALIYETPVPSGTAPLRFTWDSDENQWQVLNDPGYGIPLTIEGHDTYLEVDLDQDGISDINISLESAAQDGGYLEFDIYKESDDHSIGPDMGFDGDASYTPAASTGEVVLKTFDNTNNVIDFLENAGAGLSAQLTAAIPKGDYYDMDDLALAIENSMESASVNNIDYDVTYSSATDQFTISGGSPLTNLRLLWAGGTNTAFTAATDLGFNVADDIAGTSHSSDSAVTLFNITSSNNSIDFKEILAGSDASQTTELTATIPTGQYSDIETFARAVEDALEDESELNGNKVDYEVTYSYISHKFTIKEDGDAGLKLENFQLLWGSGSNAASNAATELGFSQEDIDAAPVEGDEVVWGLFETLFALKEYLEKDDVDGISRTMTRLDTHYNSITSVISDTGIKYNRLEVRQQVSAEAKLSINERKSLIEDADVVESIMDLTAIQTAYEASLNSTSKIINLSLVDYL